MCLLAKLLSHVSTPTPTPTQTVPRSFLSSTGQWDVLFIVMMWVSAHSALTKQHFKDIIKNVDLLIWLFDCLLAVFNVRWLFRAILRICFLRPQEWSCKFLWIKKVEIWNYRLFKTSGVCTCITHAYLQIVCLIFKVTLNDSGPGKHL